MSTLEDIRDILEYIHHLQTVLGELNGRLRRGPILLKKMDDNIQKEVAKLDQVKASHQKLLADAKSKELEVDAHDKALAKRKTQLQEAKTNKEYQALQLQIEADTVARSVLDDEALEAIERAEKFATTIPPAEDEVRKVTELYEATKQKFLIDKPGIEKEVATFTEKLKTEEGKLPRDFKDVYERLLHSVGGAEALAIVENTKYCGGCNMQIPISSLALLVARKPIVCSSCARLLYVPNGYEFDKG
jgi:predicted  nucleic acid-binding Zn-ribbon protein